MLKGLERYPARRYGSVDELSADVGRHLRHEPVAAGPPSAAYRARKFVRRHRAGVAAVSGLVLAMAVISLTTAVQNRRIAGERDRAAAEAAKAAAVTGFLQETIGAADPWQNGRDVSVRETLARAAARVDQSFQGQPLVAAAVRRAIGRTYMELGRYDDARPLLQSALAARTKVLGPQHADVAESHDDLAACCSGAATSMPPWSTIEPRSPSGAPLAPCSTSRSRCTSGENMQRRRAPARRVWRSTRSGWARPAVRRRRA